MRSRAFAVVLVAVVAAGPAFAQKQHDRGREPPTVVVPSRRPPPPKQAITVTGFAPQAGPVGTRVTITGTGFRDQTKVVFGGRPVKAAVFSETAIDFVVPSRYGDGSIVLRHPGHGNDVFVGNFTIQVALLVTGFNPPAGPPGSQVEIYGTGFVRIDAVLFNGHRLPATVQSPERLVITLPPDARDDFFTVVQRGAQAVSARRFNVIQPAPVITGFTPAAGPPGTQVRISGANFGPNDDAFYGDRDRPMRILGRGPSFLDVVIPERARNPQLLVVRGPRGDARSAQPFNLILNPEIGRFQPRSGPPGTRVEIYGDALMSGDQIVLSGRSLPIISMGPNRVTVEIVPGAASGPFQLVRGGQVMAQSRGIFQIILLPRIARFQPTSGLPGTRVTIFGQSFTPDSRFTLGPVQLPIRRLQDDRAEVEIPSGAPSGPFTVYNAGGQDTSQQTFTVIAPLVIQGWGPKSGPPGQTVRIRGVGFTPAARVFFGNIPLPIIDRDGPARLIVQIPPNAAGADYLWIEDSGQRVRTDEMFRVIILGPQPAGFSPDHGPVGTHVTILGANFSAGMRVWFNNLACDILSIGPTQVVIAIPPGAAGTFPFVLEASGQRAQTGGAFQVYSPPPPPPPPTAHHEHAHVHPHEDGGHHHHPHAHPHRSGATHHHPY